MSRRRVVGLVLGAAVSVFVLGCDASGDPLSGNQVIEYQLESVTGNPLPSVIDSARVVDGTKRYIVAVTGRLTLRPDGTVTNVMNLQRFTDSLLTGTEQGGYEGTYELTATKLSIRFRPLDEYEDTLEYDVSENGQLLSGIATRGGVWVYRRVDSAQE